MEKGVPPHPFPCLSCGVSGSPGNQEPEVPPPRVPIICEDEINFFEDLTKKFQKSRTNNYRSVAIVLAK